MDSLEEKQKISVLVDLYGGLLTERQKDFLDLYYNEDLSYGEIAESENISRQAVHDTINHGKKALARFEEHLKLIEKKQAPAVDGETASAAGNEPDLDIDLLRKEIQELSRLVSVDITYDMVPIQKQVKRLRKITGLEKS